MKVVDRAKAIWNLFTSGAMTKMDKIVLVAALLYCLSPIDIIPDVVPVVGLLDDLLVVLASVRHFSRRASAESSTAPKHDDDALIQVDAKVV